MLAWDVSDFAKLLGRFSDLDWHGNHVFNLLNTLEVKLKWMIQSMVSIHMIQSLGLNSILIEEIDKKPISVPATTLWVHTLKDTVSSEWFTSSSTIFLLSLLPKSMSPKDKGLIKRSHLTLNVQLVLLFLYICPTLSLCVNSHLLQEEASWCELSKALIYWWYVIKSHFIAVFPLQNNK